MKEEHVQSAPAQGPGLIERLRDAADLIVAGLALALLVLELWIGILPGPEGVAAAEERLEAARALLATRAEAEPEDIAERDAEMGRLEDALRATWAPPEAPAPRVEHPVAWPAVVLEARREGLENVLSFEAPDDLSGTAERGVNRLSWVRGPGHNVPLEAWQILRREGTGEGPLSPIGRVAGDVLAFDDESVRAGVTYTYRVRGLAAPGAVPEDAREGPLSEPVVLEGAADFRLTLLDADGEADTATFNVEKWHEGAFWPKRFTVAEGEVIGALDAGSGVDYTTGRILEEVTVERLATKRTLEEPVFAPDGRVLVEAGVPVREAVEVTEPFLRLTVRLEGGGLPDSRVSVEKSP